VCSSSPHRVIIFTPPRQHHLLPAQHTSYLSYPQHRVGMAERRRRRPVPIHKRGSLKTRPRCQPKAARSFEPDGCVGVKTPRKPLELPAGAALHFAVGCFFAARSSQGSASTAQQPSPLTQLPVQACQVGKERNSGRNDH
jgi:hypothetical protein